MSSERYYLRRNDMWYSRSEGRVWWLSTDHDSFQRDGLAYDEACVLAVKYDAEIVMIDGDVETVVAIGLNSGPGFNIASTRTGRMSGGPETNPVTEYFQHNVDPSTMACTWCGKPCAEITHGPLTSCPGNPRSYDGPKVNDADYVGHMLGLRHMDEPLVTTDYMELLAKARGYAKVPNVDAFHEKMGLCRVAPPMEPDTELIDLANALHDISVDMLRGNVTGIQKDRIALKIEELAEFITGVVHNDRDEIIDGLADIVYLCLGTAAIYKIDLMEAVRRVHASNMSKTPGQPKPLKGDGYFKPDFKGL